MIRLAPDPKDTTSKNTGSVTGFSNLQSQDTILEWEETSSDKIITQTNLANCILKYRCDKTSTLGHLGGSVG